MTQGGKRSQAQGLATLESASPSRRVSSVLPLMAWENDELRGGEIARSEAARNAKWCVTPRSHSTSRPWSRIEIYTSHSWKQSGLGRVGRDPANQGEIIQRLTRSPPDYNWTTWPLVASLRAGNSGECLHQNYYRKWSTYEMYLWSLKKLRECIISFIYLRVGIDFTQYVQPTRFRDQDLN